MFEQLIEMRLKGPDDHGEGHRRGTGTGVTRTGTRTAALVTLLVFANTAGAMDTQGAVDQLATQVAQGMPEGQTLKIAVTDFTDGQGVTSDYGRRVAHLLILRLAADRTLMPIEWSVLGLVLSQLGLERSDLAKLENARLLAKQFGADVVVVGSLSDLGDHVTLEARAFDIATGRPLGLASAGVTKDAKVIRMLEAGRK